MSKNFELYLPTRVVFGKGSEERTGELVRQYGASRVLIVYGSGSAKRSGLLDRIQASLEKEHIVYDELGGVVPNPRLSKVYEGIALGAKNGTDFILAVGGGSVIDTAKAIGYGLSEPEKDVWELFEKKRKTAGAVPVGAVLTIAAAGSEMSNSCVITNENGPYKRSYNDEIGRPRFAIMNPELTMTLPDYQTQSGCTDMMMHTMERYFTQETMELTDELAEGLLRNVMKYAKILHEDPMNYEARAEVMWAGSLAHNNLTGCGNSGQDGVCHALEHELGAMFDVTHGAGLDAVWGSWARYVHKDCLHRFVRFALRVMQVEPGKDDEETAMRGIEAMETFYRSVGMPTNLKELGIEPSDEQIDALAAKLAFVQGGKKGAARVLYENDFANIYRMARG